MRFLRTPHLHCFFVSLALLNGMQASLSAQGAPSASTSLVSPAVEGNAGGEADLPFVRSQRLGRSSHDYARQIIVIGFVGGFVRGDDRRHPEVRFSEYLRDRYGPQAHANVFGNHHGAAALREILRALDSDGNGTLSPDEKARARIILYGHSWGGAEALLIARELGDQGIPVLLTIQIDSIAKGRRDISTIPSNVAEAVNFYQSHGLLHGGEHIFAADPMRTTVIGNIRLTYHDHSVNCDNFRWYARLFSRTHLEIENDPRVWNIAKRLVDSEFLRPSASGEEELSK